jgi:hypothetical protein
MISNSPRPGRAKFEQLTQFLAAPTPQSLLEPGFGRGCDKHRVSAERQDDGTFVLFARSPTHRSGKTIPMGDLEAFLDGLIQEVKDTRDDDISDAVGAFRQSIHRWSQNRQAPTVADLRARIARLSAPPPSELELGNRARSRTNQFEQALKKILDALPEKDPQRHALEKAGDRLADMLFMPGATLPLEDLSSETIDLLLDTGLLAGFADLRDGVKPSLEQVVLPANAQHLLHRLQALFPTIPSWTVH